MRFKIASCVVLLLGLMCIAHARRRPTSRIPASFYGTWKISELAEVGGHGPETPELAQKEIGRTIKFGRKSISYDKDFLFFDPPCRSVSYTFAVQTIGRHDIGVKGSLDFYGLNPVKKRQIQNIVVRCNGRPVYYIELARGNKLAIYYDGWFFFLERVGE